MMKLLIGGSPCTHWSIAQTKNRETEPSGIGWELFENYLIAKEKFKPDYFLYENNKSMSKSIRDESTKRLGVEPICINSALVSAQNRQRLYWTNIPSVQQPEDRGILLRDILETGYAVREKAYALLTPKGGTTAEDAFKRRQRNVVAELVSLKSLTEKEMEYMVRETTGGRNHFDLHYYHDATRDKSSCLTANTHKGVPYNVLAEPIRIGTIENDAKNQGFDSQQYRVYSPDGKSVTLCGSGGGVGAKTGLYAVPLKEEKVGVLPNGAGELTQCQSKRIYSIDAKGRVLNAGPGGLGVQTGLYAVPCSCRNDNLVIETANGKTYPVYEVRNGLITIKGKQYPIKLKDGCYIIRKLTVTECKRLQTVPDSYEFPVSDTQAYKMLGNGWTVDVIAHILSYCPGITTEPLCVLSMYDGMACGHIALDKLGAKIVGYHATEIDKYAIKTACHNFPDIIQRGDAFQVRGW